MCALRANPVLLLHLPPRRVLSRARRRHRVYVLKEALALFLLRQTHSLASLHKAHTKRNQRLVSVCATDSVLAAVTRKGEIARKRFGIFNTQVHAGDVDGLWKLYSSFPLGIPLY